MNNPALEAAMTEALNCALVMFESAIHIQNELANVQMSDALQIQTEKVCGGLIGTKHDIISELDELDEILDSETSPGNISSRFNLMMTWFQEDIERLHHLVTALNLATDRDPECISAYVLIAESGANILNVFKKAKAAVDSLRLKSD